MSLITEINRTETEKNKTKQVATQIDNKLIELGGEQATDLSDVANKMGAMVGQYNKVAYGTFNQTESLKSLTPKKLNCNFEVKDCMIQIHVEDKRLISTPKTKPQTISCGEHFEEIQSIYLHNKEYDEPGEGIISVELANNTVTITVVKNGQPYIESSIKFLNWVAIG